MRVIAGKWRGRRLKSPVSGAVRPTSDRVKEALFSILAPRLTGTLVVDLCCGAGGLGIEALSRGAEGVVLVDRSRHSLDLARANLQLCGASPTSYELVRSDVLSWLAAWRPEAARPWVLLADPPYAAGLSGAIMERVDDLAARSDCRGASVEHAVADTAVLTRDFPTWEFRRYGGTRLGLYLPASGTA